jgi:hypothetical protein
MRDSTLTIAVLAVAGVGAYLLLSKKAEESGAAPAKKALDASSRDKIIGYIPKEEAERIQQSLNFLLSEIRAKRARDGRPATLPELRSSEFDKDTVVGYDIVRQLLGYAKGLVKELNWRDRSALVAVPVMSDPGRTAPDDLFAEDKKGYIVGDGRIFGLSSKLLAHLQKVRDEGVSKTDMLVLDKAFDDLVKGDSFFAAMVK